MLTRALVTEIQYIYQSQKNCSLKTCAFKTISENHSSELIALPGSSGLFQIKAAHASSPLMPLFRPGRVSALQDATTSSDLSLSISTSSLSLQVRKCGRKIHSMPPGTEMFGSIHSSEAFLLSQLTGGS